MRTIGENELGIGFQHGFYEIGAAEHGQLEERYAGPLFNKIFGDGLVAYMARAFDRGFEIAIAPIVFAMNDVGIVGYHRLHLAEIAVTGANEILYDVHGNGWRFLLLGCLRL